MSSLTIQRLTADYVVPRTCASPERVRRRLDDVVEKRMPAALGAMLDVPEDDAVVLIERLSVDVDLDVNADPDTLGSAWARVIAEALRCAVERNDAVRYPSRAAFVAQFVGDLAAGRAWTKWYYRCFEGLRALPASAAMRSALVMAPDVGLAALAQLEPAERMRVLCAMYDADVARVLAALAESGGRGGALEAVTAFIASVPAWSAERGDPRDVLSLAVDVASRSPGVNRKALVAAARRAVAIDHRLGRMVEVPDASEAQDAALITLLRARREQRARLHGKAYTLFGGLFMLLPLLAELAIEDPLERYAALVGCVHADRRDECLADPLWREVMAVDPQLPAAEVPVAEAATAALLASLACRLAGFAGSSPAYLFASFLDCRASLEREGDRRIVRMSPTPLHAVLMMTSLPRARFRLPWYDADFELYGEA